MSKKSDKSNLQRPGHSSNPWDPSEHRTDEDRDWITPRRSVWLFLHWKIQQIGRETSHDPHEILSNSFNEKITVFHFIGCESNSVTQCCHKLVMEVTANAIIHSDPFDLTEISA